MKTVSFSPADRPAPWGLALLLLVILLFPHEKGWAVELDELDELYSKTVESDDTELLRITLQTLASSLAGSSRPALTEARVGFLYLKLDEPDSARSAFESAIEKDSTLVEGHHGMGRLLVSKKRSRKALPYLFRALELDSTRAEIHQDLAVAHLRVGRSVRGRKAADRAIQLDPTFAAPYRFLARFHQRDGNLKAASTFYRKYLEQNPKDQKVAYDFALELLKQKKPKQAEQLATRMEGTLGHPILAHTLIDDGRHEEALDVFLEYIGDLAPEERAHYEDISLVGLPIEVRAYQSTSGEARTRFLRNFWLRKDPFKTSGGAMRRAEHYRRVWTARTHFAERQFPWDRRGEVYIRYGEPDYKSNWMEINAQVPLKAQRVQERMAHQLYGNEALALTYIGPVYPIRSDRAAEVSQRDGDAGASSKPLSTMDETRIGLERYRPVSIASDLSSVPWEVWIYTDIDEGIEVAFTDEFNTGRYDFAPVPTLSPEDIAEYNMQPFGPMRLLVQRATSLSPGARMDNLARSEPERYIFSHLEPLPFSFEALSFRGESDLIDLQVNVGLPINSVAQPEDIDTTVVVRRRVSVSDTRRGIIKSRRDDLGIPVTDENRRTNAVAPDRVDLVLEPGTYALAVEAGRTNTNRIGVFHQTIELPDYHSGKLMLSDIWLSREVKEASEVSKPAFVRGKWEITPIASKHFGVKEALFVYFEIYHLSRDEFGNTNYEVTFEVQKRESLGKIASVFSPRIRRASGETIEVSYKQVGTSETVSDYVELDLGNVDPGRFRLRMMVKDLNTGKTTTRSSPFSVAENRRRR